MSPEYLYMVIVQDSRLKPSYQTRYDGPEAADAMGVWSKAISDGVQYVTIEALIRPRPVSEVAGP